jgi:hypothetical protein
MERGREKKRMKIRENVQGRPKEDRGAGNSSRTFDSMTEAVQSPRIVITKMCSKIWKKRETRQRMSAGEVEVG